MNYGIAVFAASLLIATNARADIKLPRLVGDNMVLQRDAPLRVWGWADPGERIQQALLDWLRRPMPTVVNHGFDAVLW